MLMHAMNRKMVINHRTTKMIKFIFCSVLLSITSLAHALSSDKEQPIQISADKVEIDNASGKSIYSGNVEMTQGSVLINGNNITILTDTEGNLKKADIIGKPASFKQTPDNKEQIDAKADRIEILYEDDEQVNLYQNAVLIQGTNRFTGDKIKYLTATDQVFADSKKDSRVKVTISPRKKPNTSPDVTTEKNKEQSPLTSSKKEDKEKKQEQ